MEVLCYKHHEPLKIRKRILSTKRGKIHFIDGRCPKCKNIVYTNRSIVGNCDPLTIGGIVYQIHPDLKDRYPVEQNDQSQKAKFIRAVITDRSVICWPKETLSVSKLSGCPNDGFPLMKVRLATSKTSRTSEGYFCAKCSRAYSLSYIHQLRYEKNHQNTSVIHTDRCGFTEYGKQEFPNSTFLLIHLSRRISKNKEEDFGCIAIVSDSHDRDPSRGIYWMGKNFCSTLLLALKLNTLRNIEYKELTLRIVEHKVLAGKENQYNKALNTISRFCNPYEPQTVHIFAFKTIKGNLFPDVNNYEEVTAMIPCSGSPVPIPVNVYFEKSTNRYFMNEEQYNRLREKYGLPYMRVRQVVNNRGELREVELRPQSELRMLGYTVSASEGLSTTERRNILIYAIASRILTKSEIINHLEWLIHSREGNPQLENAINDWRSDLNFVLRIDLENQRKIWVDSFQSKYTGRRTILR